MDDPLRPKIVPLAAETILWFEFLLNPSLLTKHLEKNNPDPSPIELINQFISMTPDQTTNATFDLTTPGVAESETVGGIPVTPGSYAEGLKMNRKQLAIKILSLKVATYLKWDLDLLEKSLPIQKQMLLIGDLCTIASGKPVHLPLAADSISKIAPESSDKATLFALTLYHRWVLRLQIIKDINAKAAKPPNTANPMPPTEPILQCFAPDFPIQQSIEFLKKLCNSTDPFHIFTYDSLTFSDKSEDFAGQDFDLMKQITNFELRAQLYFDLANFYLFAKQYVKAKEAIVECQSNWNQFRTDYKTDQFLYCHFSQVELQACLTACGISSRLLTLTEKFNVSILDDYKDIIAILKTDNKFREIPVVSRRILELDIEGAIAHNALNESTEFAMQISALNVIRDIFNPEHSFARIDYFEKYKSNENCYSFITEGIIDILPHCSMTDRNQIKQFLIDCVLKTEDGGTFIPHLNSLKIFSNMEIEDLKKQTSENAITMPPLAVQSDWKCNSKITRIEVGSLERQLISCTNATTVRKLLVKLAATNPSKPLWTVNPSWQISTPINSLLMSMQRGFLQDFAYVLLGKAREMAAKKDFIGAVSMLSVLKSETQRPELATGASKLGKLVVWEILLIQICQCLEEWNKKPLDLQSLAVRCKQCIGSLQSGDNCVPRIEIIEHLAIMLLNLNEWSALSFLDKRLPQLELPIAFASTFIEMEKLKGSKKVCRDAWDIILTMFTTTNKRGGPGSRNSPGLAISNNLHPFFYRIRDQAVFALAISLLAKIHNILKDDPSLDLNGEHMHLWPTNISNPIGYSIRAVSESLNLLLTEALKYYPQNISWLKMKGDLEFVAGNNESAMKYYVNAVVIATENWRVDDYVIRKMMRCSANLGCHLQAVVLAQFLDDVDYSLALKNISEKSLNFSDAMDSYYHCIWDQTLLEFIIALHTKKGENIRKLEAIAVMTNCEINPNNNDEIKRETIALRKSRFIRALAKQYMM